MVSKRPCLKVAWHNVGGGRGVTEQTAARPAALSMKNFQNKKEILRPRRRMRRRNKGGQRKGTMVDSFFVVGLSRRSRMRQKNRFLYGLNKQRERERERERERMREEERKEARDERKEEREGREEGRKERGLEGQ